MNDFLPIWENKIKFNNHKNLPNSLRCLIVGSSGCGKTCLLLKMLLTPNFLDYDNLIIFTKSSFQPEYQLLSQGFNAGLQKEDIIGLFKLQKNLNDYNIEDIIQLFCDTQRCKKKSKPITCILSDNTDDIPSPQELDKSKKNLVIFDDCVNERNQTVMDSYYTRGRHSSCNCIYLSQSYFQLPRRSIRNNANTFILFKLNSIDINNFWRDNCSTLCSKKEFGDYMKHTTEKYKYIVVKQYEILNDIFQ